MEFNNLSFLTILSTTLSVIPLLLVPFLLLQFINKKRVVTDIIKPPEVKGAWPVIGNLHLLCGSKLPHKVLADLADKYGPVFTIKLGFHKVLVVSNGEIAKECFTTNDRVFASRPKSQAFELMTYTYAMFGFSPYGDYWRKMRKIVMLEVLSQRRVQMHEHIRDSEIKVSTKNLYDVWVKNKECKDLDTVKVDMKQWFEDLVLNVVVRILSGKTFSVNDEERARFHVVIRKFFELLGAFVVSDYIPFLKYFDLDGTKKLMKKVAKELGGILDEWLYELKLNRESREQHHEGNQVFINALDSILQGASEDEFSGFDHDTIIKATCQQVLAAALDTTSTTLTWALSLLLNSPTTLETVQLEIDEHVGKERLVEESDLKNLVYLEAVIKETMRLYPAAPLSVPHESMEDCIVGGYSIPKGTRLIVNLSKIHHDPNIWSDPYKFQPERFLNSHKDVDFKGKHFELIPFGSGRRMCPGVYLALQELHFTLASVIQQFVLTKVSEEEPIDMNECGGLTVSKKTPLELLLTPRLSPNMYV